MPPSGFAQRARNGAHELFEGCIEDLDQEVIDGKWPDLPAGIRGELAALKLVTAAPETPDGVVRGTLEFAKGVYSYADEELASGKHPNPRSAINAALDRAEVLIAELHINKKGELVRRPQ
ncbi:MAG: hypothetical protein WDN10_03470 [bacterium]